MFRTEDKLGAITYMLFGAFMGLVVMLVIAGALVEFTDLRQGSVKAAWRQK